jgi:hypothetical protein
MILTDEEYNRGFIDFDAELPKGCSVNIWTDTTDNPNEQSEGWTGPYSIPSGCKVTSLSKQYVRLKVELKRADDPSKTPVLKHIRWERDGKTFLWPGARGFIGPPGALVLGRDYGSSYRLVFKPQKAFWDKPIILIEKTIRVRFGKGKIEGHEVTGFEEEVPNRDGTTSIEGAIKETTAEGDFVEILATLPTENKSEGKEIAKSQVESIAGLLSLCFGEQVLGKKIFEDYYFSSATNEEGEIKIPVKQLKTQPITSVSASVADISAEKLRFSPLGTSMGLALRWYAKGLMYESPMDQFIAYFIGLDSLVSGYFANISPVPVRKEYKQLQEYFTKAQPKIDNGLKEVALARLTDFPLNNKFDYYWKHHFHEETKFGGKFPMLNRLRSELLHGKAQSISPDDVNIAKTILEKLLGRELSLDELIVARQEGPKLLEAMLTYRVQATDQ